MVDQSTPFFHSLVEEYRISSLLEIISTLLRRIGIPPPTAPPGESLCIKTGNQTGGRVFSRFDHVIRGGPKYTNFLHLVEECP